MRLSLLFGLVLIMLPPSAGSAQSGASFTPVAKISGSSLSALFSSPFIQPSTLLLTGKPLPFLRRQAIREIPPFG
jgi:hypothetical protein